MRKKAQEEKRAAAEAASPTSSSCQSSLSSSNHSVVDSVHASKKAGEESFYDTGGINIVGEDQDGDQKGYSMDDIWKDIAMFEENILQPVYDGHSSEEGCNFSCPQVPSPSWEYSDPLWVMDEEESKMLFPSSDQYFSCYEQGTAFLTG